MERGATCLFRKKQRKTEAKGSLLTMTIHTNNGGHGQGSGKSTSKYKENKCYQHRERDIFPS